MGTKQHAATDAGVDDLELPDEKAFAVTDCLEFVEGRMNLYPGARILKEQYVPIDSEKIVAADGTIFVGTTAGYYDAAILSADGKTVEVIDHKFGQVAVEDAENNLQGMSYLLGLVNLFPTIEKGVVHFVMPHRDEVTSATFTRDQFDGMRIRIRTVVQRAIEAAKISDDFSTASPNQSACLFCSLVGKCPKVAAIALKVGHKYAPLAIPESISTTVFQDSAQVALGLKLSGIIKVWAEAYRKQATEKTIESPDFVPEGYKLVSVSKRKVVNAKRLGDLAKECLPEADRSKVDALYDIPIGKVEKLISIAAPRGQKEAAVEEFGLSALAMGAVEEGQPFAFLRQDNSKT